MKFFRTLCVLFLLLVFSNMPVLANSKSFSAKATEAENFIAKTPIEVLTEEPNKNTIKCFDVNDNGLIAIGSENSNVKTISIYSNKGKFLVGYRFDCIGSFGIKIDEKSLDIYFVRSSVVLKINFDGKVKSFLNLEDLLESNTYFNKKVFSTKRELNNKKYILKNDMGFFNIFATSYNQLVVIDSNGTEKIIYDVNNKQLSKTKSAVIGGGLIIFLIIAGVFAQIVIIIKNQKSKKTGDEP